MYAPDKNWFCRLCMTLNQNRFRINNSANCRSTKQNFVANKDIKWAAANNINVKSWTTWLKVMLSRLKMLEAGARIRKLWWFCPALIARWTSPVVWSFSSRPYPEQMEPELQHAIAKLSLMNAMMWQGILQPTQERGLSDRDLERQLGFRPMQIGCQDDVSKLAAFTITLTQIFSETY